MDAEVLSTRFFAAVPGRPAGEITSYGRSSLRVKIQVVLAVALIAGALAGSQSPVRAEEHYTKLTDIRVEMDDGVPIAADVYVPSRSDGDGDGLYPCVIELTPYRKESRAAEGASYLPEKGIALIEVDARGTGGSGGEYDIVFSVREQADTVAMIDWAATQATTDGKPLRDDGKNKLCEETVGLYGGSYSGIIQYLVASLPMRKGDTGFGRLPSGTKHLAAIAPQRAYGDLYRDIVYHGGMLIGSFGNLWSGGTSSYYLRPPMDFYTAEGQQAWTDHVTKNDPLLAHYIDAPYEDAKYTSDDTEPSFSQKLYEDSSALPRIKNLRVPSLHLAGFFDAFTRGQLLTFQEAHRLEQKGNRGPNFLIAGPWDHTGTHFISPDQGFREQLSDWYLYWLEGESSGASQPEWIRRGFDGRGARVTYFQSETGVVNGQSDEDGSWTTSPSWPPRIDDVKRLYLAPGGMLSSDPPTEEEGADTYLANPTAGLAELLSRWDNAAGTPHPSFDQRIEGPKGLTYQTDVLSEPLKVAGPIALRLQASTVGLPEGPDGQWPGATQQLPPYHDTDWVVKVSDVAPDGTANLITAGYLRASHRRVDESKSLKIRGEMLMPYHPHTKKSLQPPVPGEIQEYLIEVWPTAMTFKQGHRLRIDIYSSDTPNHLSLLRPALNTVQRNVQAASYLMLPVSGGRSGKG